MKVGSIVETVGNFEHLRTVWNLSYPKKGDLLTVSSVTKHGNPDVAKMGIVLLNFEELSGMTGLCDKDVHGQLNFRELELPQSIKEIFEPKMNTNLKKVHP